MPLSIDQERYLLQRKQEIQREMQDLERSGRLRYHDLNERRLDLGDELAEIENELRKWRSE